jgi:hypothetical protein
MKKNSITLFITICIAFSSFAQKQKEIKYKKTFYNNQTVENADMKIMIDDAVATMMGIKFKVRIENKTNDYIIFKATECEFQIKDSKVNPVEKWIIIAPNDKESKVIDIKGSQYILPENFTFKMAGFYKVSLDAKGNITPDFKLPPTTNEFKSGGFSVSVDGFKKTTTQTDAKFKVTYNGDKIGVLDINKIGVKMPDGKEYANFLSEKRPVIFDKGKSDDFKVLWKNLSPESGDMQKVDMMILWRDAFKEITPVKIPTLDLLILFDEETSFTKGR